MEITIPKITNIESDEKEIFNIQCTIEFNSPGYIRCLLDCEFNIEIIPLHIIVYCVEYNFAKNNDDNYNLYITEILSVILLIYILIIIILIKYLILLIKLNL